MLIFYKHSISTCDLISLQGKFQIVHYNLEFAGLLSNILYIILVYKTEGY